MKNCQNCIWAKPDPNMICWFTKAYYWLYKRWPDGILSNLVCTHTTSTFTDNKGHKSPKRCWEIRKYLTTGCTKNGIYFEERKTPL